MPYEFDAEIKRLEGKMAWPVIYAPAALVEEQGTNSRINVRAVIDGREFLGVLLPSRNGHYLVYSREMKEHCKKEQGESVHVLLEPDDRPRSVEMPDDVKTVLEPDQELKARFLALPYYIQREEINRINGAKTDPTRQKRIAELVQTLKR